jgi:glycosyltransferase involved in cell wall biosynthesis
MSKVSIIVVNYNGRKIVGACLEALLRQNYEEFKALIVDNGSSDGSLFEIQRFLKEIPIALRVELIALKYISTPRRNGAFKRFCNWKG